MGNGVVEDTGVGMDCRLRLRLGWVDVERKRSARTDYFCDVTAGTGTGTGSGGDCCCCLSAVPLVFCTPLKIAVWLPVSRAREPIVQCPAK